MRWDEVEVLCYFDKAENCDRLEFVGTTLAIPAERGAKLIEDIRNAMAKAHRCWKCGDKVRGSRCHCDNDE